MSEFEIEEGSALKDDFSKYFEKGDSLGVGSFGSVCLVTRKKDSKKFILKESILPDKNEKIIKLIEREPVLLMQLKRYNHPNIMKIETWFKNKDRDRVNMIINYVGTETLRKYVGKVGKKGLIKEETVKKIFG